MQRLIVFGAPPRQLAQGSFPTRDSASTEKGVAGILTPNSEPCRSPIESFDERSTTATSLALCLCQTQYPLHFVNGNATENDLLLHADCARGCADLAYPTRGRRNHSITPFATTSRQRSHTTCPLGLRSDAKPSTLRGRISHRKNSGGIVQTDYPEKGNSAWSAYGVYSQKTYAQDMAPWFSWLIFRAKSRRKIGNRSAENATKAAVEPIVQTLSFAARRVNFGPPVALPGRPPVAPPRAFRSPASRSAASAVLAPPKIRIRSET